jgi:hypothetical protein
MLLLTSSSKMIQITNIIFIKKEIRKSHVNLNALKLPNSFIRHSKISNFLNRRMEKRMKRF